MNRNLQMLWNEPSRGKQSIILAHGAGAPMDTPFMTYFAEGLAGKGFRVGRFEFPYMAARRATGKKKPPDKLDVLLATWRAVIADAGPGVVIGGKSMGGRIASLVADDAGVRGLVCLGYPFFGMGRKDKPRVAHLATLKTPTLICQGERDPMGNRADVAALSLSSKIKIEWLPDGDHDLKPRKSSGRTHQDNLVAALTAVSDFVAKLA